MDQGIVNFVSVHSANVPGINVYSKFMKGGMLLVTQANAHFFQKPSKLGYLAKIEASLLLTPDLSLLALLARQSV